MAAWQTFGHTDAVETLARGMRSGRVAHAYLLVGAPQVGKMTLALDIARMVNCVASDAASMPCGECRQCARISAGLHADVRVIAQDAGDGRDTPARTAISVEQIREAQREAVLKPYEGRRRVFIIDGAERFTQEAANALLKMLEEPPEAVQFVLLATSVRESGADESAGGGAYADYQADNRIAALLDAVPEAGGVLPTILSRCQTLELRPLPSKLIADELEQRFGTAADEAQRIARLSMGRPGWALQAAQDPQLLAAHAERLDEIQEAISGGLQERFAYAERQAAAFGKSRAAVYADLDLWLLWWRDALVIGQGNADLVINLARMDALQAAAQACSAAQVVGAIRAAQETIAMLESNVNPRLALEGMMLRLPENPLAGVGSTQS